jgi:hypothetical protein
MASKVLIFLIPLPTLNGDSMNYYKRLNNILGWIVFTIASTVYILTSEPTMSFWDCGEYIATAYKMEVGHSPGAPLFQIIGRFFSMFSFGDVTMVARMVNTMSALASGFTILFLFWSITMIAKKIIIKTGNELTHDKTFVIMGAALVGALAYTFTDSFWFSAVEGEVYAMSSFFTAIVFWAILKWEEHADEKHAYRWLILIAYLMGLSIGVHLLNLLAIPAITLVYYFKKYPSPNWKGILLATAFSIIILAFVMYIIIPWFIKLAGLFELFFVNSIGMPFNSGTAIYFILVIGLIVMGLIFTRRKGKTVLNTLILAFTFIIIGYTSFLMLVIRSNANTPIDENNPENAMYLLSYLNREQYGDWPLLTGQYYNAPAIARTDGTPVYTKDKAAGKYLITDKKEKINPVYDPRFTTVFPRMWANMEQRYIDDYKRWGKVQGVPVEVQGGGEKPETRYVPTFAENLRFFWNYQVIHMYFRYFMWNFAGKQNDNQGYGNKIDGNWKSGIPFIDKYRLGSQDIPEIRKNKADNSFYFLPLILGLVGLVFTVRKDYKNAVVIGLLFIMTGLAIVIYLNQYSPQPRERDYAYAGSFYAFAIWIGLGVMQLVEWLNKNLNARISVIIATLLSLILVPGVLAKQGWDDHDRSGRYTALALAENYLNSCDPNAILFTNGDNDTFPLWYAQEVEGIRTDVRVVNLSLLNMDWYIDQMKRKAYDSDVVPFSLTREKYRQGSHDVTYIVEDPGLKDQFISLQELFTILNTDESKLKLPTEQYGSVDFFPSRRFYVGYDSLNIVNNKLVPAKYLSRLNPLRWEYKQNAVEKSNLMILDLLATNNWKRPVYFAMTMGQDSYIGLDKYFFLEGLAFRLLPVNANSPEGQPGEVNTDKMYDNMMNKFIWGNMQDPGVYLDENNLRMTMNFRNAFGRLAGELIKEGKTDSARKVLDRCMEVMPEKNVPFNFFAVQIIEGYCRIGELQKASGLAERYFSQLEEELAYLFSFPDEDLKLFDLTLQEDLMSMEKLKTMATEYKLDALAKKAEPVFQNYYQQYVNKVYQKQ